MNLRRWYQNHKKKKARTENIQCPVCGYYCLGKGGVGCVDKPTLCKL